MPPENRYLGHFHDSFVKARFGGKNQARPLSERDLLAPRLKRKPRHAKAPNGPAPETGLLALGKVERRRHGQLIGIKLRSPACMATSNRGSFVMTRWFFAVLALVLAVGAGFVLLAFQRELARARAAAHQGSMIADTEAGPVEYAESGQGYPVLSIHGAGGGFDQGLTLAHDLIGEGFHIIAPSRFGYLRTPIAKDGSPPAQADVHDALLAELNITRAVIVGVSAGARSAVELAIRHPARVAALVLIVPGTYSPTSPVSITAGRGNEFAFWAVNNGGDFAWWA
ncbi:MAG TPA: alpha/beta hydrolase, partial [Rhizomicrobium sp.]|nr:alpha/beta hydrolase [Rhizomicrobium sp.]